MIARPAPSTLRRALLVLGCALALGWLFERADSVSNDEHQPYARELRELRAAAAELDLAVLGSRLGLAADFDALVAGSRRVHAQLDRLAGLPSFLSPEDGRQLRDQIEAYRSLQQHKDALIDHFKREHSVLRNSLSYFPHAVEELLARPDLPAALAAPIDRLAHAVMATAIGVELPGGAGARDGIEALERAAERHPAHRDALRNVLAHAGLILERAPRVDALNRQIVSLPNAALGERLVHAYGAGHERAARIAGGYRAVLLLAALALGCYLVLEKGRLRRASAELAAANHELSDKLEALRHTEDALRLYAAVFTEASEGMLITDAEARIVAVNPAFTRITGYRPEDVEGRKPSILGSGRHGGDYYRDMWATLASRGQWQGEIWNRRRDGTVFPEWLSITAIRDGDAPPNRYIGIFSDVTERKEAEARISHLAHHDPLTSLPNRALFLDRLNQAVLKARRDGRRAAVLFLDLDRFKAINDSLGHDAGDALLLQFRDRCLAQIRDTDTLGRLGSDEFAFALPEVGGTQDAAAIARKLLAAIAAPYRIGEHELTVTASLGVALYPDDAQRAHDLLRNAESAMQRSKSIGRGNYQFYSADMNTTSLGELLLENQLRGALVRDELRLHYQPKVEARSGRLIGAEALLRWQHPELGLLGPGRFVPAAEASGLIVPIGEWVLREACRQLRSWIDAGLEPVPVAVNLSAAQFVQQDLVALVRDTLAANRLPAGLLELELTETMLMSDIERTIDTLSRLRKMGVALSIDDFGSGYSSLAYLRQFEVNVLKIDRSFVADIGEDATDGKIATAVIALGHSLGLQVIAEGVETEAQRDFLAARGCNHLQGYLFDRPLPAGEFARRLARG